MTAPVFLDVSDIVVAPFRSGIQRVEREAIRHWPGPAPLVPCHVAADGELRRLPDAVMAVLCREDDDSTAAREAEARELRRLRERGEPMPPGQAAQLLNLELFYDERRARAHMRAAAAGTRLAYYMYDFLPFLRPELFPGLAARNCMPFLRATRHVAATGGRLAFLSEHTAAEYAHRVARRPLPPEWPVISPGADALGLERQNFAPERRAFVSIGTVEPRKNTLALLLAFEALWAGGHPTPLVIAGRIEPTAVQERAFFARYADRVRLTVLEQPSDAALRNVLRSARALIMPSEAEGFGLPPYEALFAGVPSIASASLPSAAMLTAGVILLDRMSPAAIAAAVASLLPDAVAADLWTAAASVDLPSWAEFGRVLGAWAQQG